MKKLFLIFFSIFLIGFVAAQCCDQYISCGFSGYNYCTYQWTCVGTWCNAGYTCVAGTCVKGTGGECECLGNNGDYHCGSSVPNSCGQYVCGTGTNCPAGQQCVGGTCQIVCSGPSPCTGSNCGAITGGDGCTYSCTCSSGTCSGGTCTSPPPPPCVPNCAGKNCGDDGCGGSCGSCSSGYTCSGGSCQSTGGGNGGPISQCNNIGSLIMKQCVSYNNRYYQECVCSVGYGGYGGGTIPLGGGTIGGGGGYIPPGGTQPCYWGSLKQCPVGQICSGFGYNVQCVDDCTPDCTGKCGGASDGCSGTCNTCGVGETCVSQQCCVENDYQECSGGDSYNFDSCGNIGTLVDNCTEVLECTVGEDAVCVGGKKNVNTGDQGDCSDCSAGVCGTCIPECPKIEIDSIDRDGDGTHSFCEEENVWSLDNETNVNMINLDIGYGIQETAITMIVSQTPPEVVEGSQVFFEISEDGSHVDSIPGEVKGGEAVGVWIINEGYLNSKFTDLSDPENFDSLTFKANEGISGWISSESEELELNITLFGSVAQECGQYQDQSQCDGDVAYIWKDKAPEITFKDSNENCVVEITKYCGWNGAGIPGSQCETVLDQTKGDPYNNEECGSLREGPCHYVTDNINGNCDQGDEYFSVDYVSDEDECPAWTSGIIVCPQQLRLPFFGIFNFLITMGLIGILHFVVYRRQSQDL